jgi:probable HAF family extracellular repeat protein
LWAMGSVRDLGTLGGKHSEAVAVNNHGLVVGTSETTSGADHGFLWRAGKMIDLGTLGGRTSEVVSYLTNGDPINERGDIVGVSETKSGAMHAFLWRNGAITDLGIAVPKWEPATVVAINERGQVLVSTENKSILWDRGKSTSLGTLGGTCTEPEGLNDLGDIVGASCLRSANPKLQGRPHAFVWQDGVMTDLGRDGTGPSDSRAYAINNKRQIVGATLTGEIARAGTSTQTTVQHAVLWTRTNG